MKPTNVLHVIARMDPELGGVSKAVQMIVAGLGKHQIKSEVVSVDAADAAYLDAYGFPIHALGEGRRPWSYSNKLSSWLHNNLPRFEVVIVHGLWLYTGFAVERAIRYLKKSKPFNEKINHAVPKVFVMPHGMLDPYFQKAAGRKLKAFRNWVYWKLIESKVVNNCDGLLFTCEEEKQLAKQPFRPYLPKKEFVVSLGVEEPPAFTTQMQRTFYKDCSALNSNAYFLFLGRIDEKKGVDILIKSYAALYGNTTTQIAANNGRQLYSSGEIPKLVIAGPGLDSEYGGKIKQFVSKNDLIKNNVFFTGMLTGNAKWGAFYGCESFILPSHQENFGIAVVEALACKKAVLISNQVNIWREIAATDAGIVENDTQNGVDNLLKTWSLLSSAERTGMEKRARETYENNFSIERASIKILNAISGKY